MIQKENLTPNSSIGSRNTRTSWTARAVAATAAVRRGVVTHTPQPMREAPFWDTNTVKHPYRHLCTRTRDLPQIPHQSAIRPPKVQQHHFLYTLFNTKPAHFTVKILVNPVTFLVCLF